MIATVALLLALCIVRSNEYVAYYKTLAYPGLVFMGAFAVPFSMLIFFFETNVFRNISLAETVNVFFLGGVACLVVLNFLPQTLSPFSPQDNPTATQHIFNCFAVGFVEEAAKIIIIVIVFRLRKTQGPYYVLNGMLIGAAIGAGAGVFESAAYINWYSIPLDSLVNVMVVRGILAVGTHVAWGAIEGAALALGDKEHHVEVGQVINPVALSMFTFKNPAFLATFVSCALLHSVWNINFAYYFAPLAFLDTYFIKYAILVIIAWIIVLVMLNRGIEQVNEISS